MVGLGSSISAVAAEAPLASPEMLMTPKEIVKEKVMEQWNSDREYSCVVELIDHESRWNPLALNESSGAFGLFQFMPETWGNYKYPFMSKDVNIQIKAGLRYITKRYGSPCEAWAFWQNNAKRGNPWY
jgi:SLT domain-containing protein